MLKVTVISILQYKHHREMGPVPIGRKHPEPQRQELRPSHVAKASFTSSSNPVNSRVQDIAL